MIGQIISHYKIIDKLGEGGMGEVFKAEDTILKRVVALKFLPLSFSADREAKKRFIHEARSASALDHLNICNIHEIGETDKGQLFISMSCYEGETLQDKIEKGNLNIEQVLDISLQICEGLKKAHQNNITHRDIKPANIYITNDGVVKILDFGLAKAKGQSQLTQIGTTVGTISYMSPEQTRGEEVDQRTDIWSIGVVIYEMLTGNLPFKGDYDQAVIYSILNEKPELNYLPNEIVHVIKKAIAKQKEDRYQNVEDMINDLLSVKNGSEARKYFSLLKPISLKIKMTAIAFLFIAAASIIYLSIYKPVINQANGTAPERKMIVVLPFENLGSPEDEYFAQGMREEISNKLAELGSIGVISRSSAEKFANTKKTAKEIGKELGVDYILEGTVQWARSKGNPDQIRIIPQLIRVSDDINIWSDSYDRVINDVFKMQNEIAQNVVDKLGIKILPRQFASESPPTKNLDAYEYYLKAAGLEFNHISNSDIIKSINNYNTAIELDPGFAAAHALLATVYMGSYFYIKRDSAIIEKINIHLQKARQLNPNLAEFHLAQGYYYYYFIPNGLQKALEEFKKTLKIRPNNAEANLAIGIINIFLGKYELELPFFLKAFALDPLNTRYAQAVGGAYNAQHEYKSAEKYFKRAIELNPSESDLYIVLAKNYIDWKGDMKVARQIIKNVKNDEYLKFRPNIFIYFNIIEKNFSEALTQLKSSKKEYEDSYFNFIPNYQMIALIYRYLKNDELSRKYFDSAKIKVEKMISTNPEDIRLPISLSITYAGLNKKAEALAAFNKAMELAPKNVEIFDKVYQVNDLAQIYTLLGDYDDALKQLNYLLSNYTGFSVNRLKYDPIYDKLRNMPAYTELIQKYSNEREN